VGDRRAKLTPYGRLLIAQRVLELGWTAEAVTAAGVSRATAPQVGPSLSRGGVDRPWGSVLQTAALPPTRPRPARCNGSFEPAGV
jgi:hypothetical protein